MPAAKDYPTRQLGRNGPAVSAIGFGTMGIGAFYGKTDLNQALETLTYAADRGVSFWDCADIYGNTEKVLGEWFKKTGRRDEIFLATKFGAYELDVDVGKFVPNSKPSYIRKAVQRSLDNLQTSSIDLYYQHRVDPEVPIEVVIKILLELVAEGKIKYIGLSECSAATLKRALAVEGAAKYLIAAQMEFSPFALDYEKIGFLDTLKETGVSLVAYSPLGRGLASGRFKSRADFGSDDIRLMFPRFSEENFPKNLAIVDELKKLGKKYDLTSSQVALAWILAEYPTAVPIPGSRTAERLEENVASAEKKLNAEDVKAVRALAEAADSNGGERIVPQFYSSGDCIPLGEWKGEMVA